MPISPLNRPVSTQRALICRDSHNAATDKSRRKPGMMEEGKAELLASPHACHAVADSGYWRGANEVVDRVVRGRATPAPSLRGTASAPITPRYPIC